MGKKIFVILMTCIMLMGEVEVQAATYAYGIGSEIDSTYDYTINPTVAAAEYSRLQNVTAYQMYYATGTYVRGNNPNGNRRIASKLVFFNGHANYQRIFFNYHNDPLYMCGICTGNDKVDGGYTFAGLASTDMSTCKLATFVGCDTGNDGESQRCLAEKAVYEGATTAVGWEGTIYSLSDTGKDWLCLYNANIGRGGTVTASVQVAINEYPNARMSNNINIFGNASLSFTPRSVGDTQDAVKLEELDAVDITEYDNNYILDALEDYDSTIDLTNYKVTSHLYDKNNGNGYVAFTYFINGEICTNKSYICHIENNKLSYIHYTLEDEDTAVAYSLTNNLSENEIVSKVNNHKNSKVAKASAENLVTLEEYIEEYFYNYKKNKLFYREYVAVNDTTLDVVIPNMSQDEL